jgi:hypothetical protein
MAVVLSSAVSAGEIDATVRLDGNEGSISFFDTECGPECTTVELICGTGASFSIVVIDFDNKQLSDWLTTSDAKASLLIDGVRIGLRGESMQFTDLNGTWDLTLALGYAEKASPWKALRHAKSAKVQVGSRDVTIPTGPGVQAKTEQLIKACTAGAGESP